MLNLKLLIGSVAICALAVVARPANAAVTVGVDPNANWLGFMNFFNLPADGFGYMGGNQWGTADLRAGFNGNVVTLAPNTSVDRDKPNDPFFWKADGTSNKYMDANFYVEDSATLPGQVVTFTGNVLSNTLVSPYTATAFIKDFAPNYSSFTTVAAPLTPGAFSITLPTTAQGHHIQYGFEMIGPDARQADAERLGMVQVTAAGTAPIPEPSTLALFASSAVGLLAFRRKNKA